MCESPKANVFPQNLKVNLEVMNCNFHRYDYLEFTDARGAKTRYDTKVGTEKWPKVSTFNILNQVKYPFVGNSYDPCRKPVVYKDVCVLACMSLFPLKGGVGGEGRNVK